MRSIFNLLPLKNLPNRNSAAVIRRVPGTSCQYRRFFLIIFRAAQMFLRSRSLPVLPAVTVIRYCLFTAGHLFIPETAGGRISENSVSRYSSAETMWAVRFRCGFSAPELSLRPLINAAGSSRKSRWRKRFLRGFRFFSV